MQQNMTSLMMESAMEKGKLSDAERVVIRNGYLKLVILGWPIEYISLSMCKEADRRQFDKWADCLTLVEYQTRRAHEKLRDETANGLSPQML